MCTNIPTSKGIFKHFASDAAEKIFADGPKKKKSRHVCWNETLLIHCFSEEADVANFVIRRMFHRSMIPKKEMS